MSMHMPLIAKMVENNPFFMVVQVNFKLLCDVNLFIFLFDLMPMLETIHPLIKFAHKQDVFVCDYVVAINICYGQLYFYYSNHAMKYIHAIVVDL